MGDDTHGSGCFPCSWMKKKRPGPTSKPSGSKVRRVPHHTLYYSPNDLFNDLQRQPSSIEEEVLSEKAEKAKPLGPTGAEYAIEATKKTINILKGVADVIPFPLVKDIIQLGLNIISTCEAIHDVQDRVAGLKNRIATFLLVVAKVSKSPSEDDDSRQKISQELASDLSELKDCLATIIKRLDAINSQNALLTGLLSEPNMKVIDECELEFQGGVDRFQTLRAICATEDMATIQQQLIKMYGITQEMYNDVKATRETVEGIQSSVNDLKSMLSKDNSESAVATTLAKMPRAPGIFFGREAVVERVAQQLSSGDGSLSRVCLLGPGGMGKTSVALAIMEDPSVKGHFLEHNRFWIPCISANSPSLLLSIISKHIHARKELDDPLEDIISTLRQNTEPKIILLDNFETSWHPVAGDQETVRQILEALDALPHVAVLVTMRSEFSPLDHWKTERLLEVKPEDSRRIYTAIDSSAAECTELDTLLDALGHLPYAITLMASRGKRSFATPAQLLEEWNELGTSMISKSKQGIDHSIGLSLNSKFVTDSPGAIRLLQTISMLPTGVYYNDLNTWVKGWKSEAVDTLRDAALVLAREVHVQGKQRIHLLVLPVVQSYMKQQGRIPADVRNAVHTACYSFLVEHNGTIKGPDHPNFRQHLTEIATQESNIQALLTEMTSNALTEDGTTSIPHPQRLEALLAFAWFQYWTRPRPELCEAAVALARKYKNQEYEAKLLFCLGYILWRTDKLEPYRQAYKEALALFKKQGNHLFAIRSELMIIDSCEWSVEGANEGLLQMEEMKARWKERYEADPILKAYICSTEGCLAWRASRLDSALTLLRQGLEDFKACGEMYEVQNCTWWMSRCYGSLHDFDSAIEYIDVAIEWDKEILGSDEQERGFIFQDSIATYLQKVRYLKGADRWDDELERALRTALESCQELGLSRTLVHCLIEYGELYVRKGDWKAARVAYQEIIRRMEGLYDVSAVDIKTDAQNNLLYVEDMAAGVEAPQRNFWTPGRG